MSVDKGFSHGLHPHILSAGKSPYILSTQVLLPGNQIFILVTEDGYGESLMKIYPFTVSSGMDLTTCHVYA